MPPRNDVDLARVLLAKALDDETLVRTVADNTDIADGIVGFHAQQTAEKLIKAVLAAHGVVYAKRHDLDYLIDLIEQSGIDKPGELDDAEALSPWAVELRYDDEDPPPLDRAETLALLAPLRIWAESQIELASSSARADEETDWSDEK